MGIRSGTDAVSSLMSCCAWSRHSIVRWVTSSSCWRTWRKN